MLNLFRLVGIAVILMFVAPSARADTLPRQLLKTAEKVTEDLLEKNRESLSLGEFVPKGKDAEDAFGPGLRVELAQAFNQVIKDGNKKMNLLEESSLVLSGTYEVIDDPADIGAKAKGLPQLLVLKVEMVLLDGSEKLSTHTFFVDRIRDIVEAEGASGFFRLEDDTRTLHKQVREAIREPSAQKLGSRVKSSVDSQVSVEILTKSASAEKSPASPREMEIQKGVASLSIAQGEVYEILFHNQSEEEIAVAATIDGIDQFTFSEDRDSRTGRPLFTHWIVPKKSDLTIFGWHKTADPERKDNVLRFLVTKYGDGASQFAPHTDKSKVGVIQLAISRSHEQKVGARGDAETGFGPPVEVRQTKVQRVIDPPHEFIAIRYTKS